MTTKNNAPRVLRKSQKAHPFCGSAQNKSHICAIVLNTNRYGGRLVLIEPKRHKPSSYLRHLLASTYNGARSQ